MVLGAITCPRSLARQVSRDLKKLKTQFGIAPTSEIKWSKISPGNAEFYCSVVDYYFRTEALSFRCVIATGKKKLDHKLHKQDHDIWYFKMYFLLLQYLLDPSNKYRILVDVKDTRSQAKIKNLHDVLCNEHYDFDREIVEDIRTVSSHTTPCLQLTDLFTGALSYVHRGLTENAGKLRVIEEIRRLSHKSLMNKTLVRERKLNIFIWTPRKSEDNVSP
jgi:hypothetical protein